MIRSIRPQAGTAQESPDREYDRDALRLRDVTDDGQLVVDRTQVRGGHSHTEARHVSARLPAECLTLFDGGAVAVDDLTDEECAWVASESGLEVGA